MCLIKCVPCPVLSATEHHIRNGSLSVNACIVFLFYFCILIYFTLLCTAMKDIDHKSGFKTGAYITNRMRYDAEKLVFSSIYSGFLGVFFIFKSQYMDVKLRGSFRFEAMRIISNSQKKEHASTKSRDYNENKWTA